MPYLKIVGIKKELSIGENPGGQAKKTHFKQVVRHCFGADVYIEKVGND
jgi:hypothetical protein